MNNILDLIGNTPLVELRNIKTKYQLKSKIYAKLELQNPTGSVKDRTALSLINDPKVLFLDEPTLGLDVIARKELWNIINNLKGEITIILTTHYMEEAEKLSDRVGIMANGSLVDIGTVDELIKKTNSKSFEEAFVNIATGGNLK